jgi:hypothetical protein
MAHGYDVNHPLVVQHLVDHTVMSDTNTPKTLQTMKLAATRRVWILGQRFYLGESPVDDAGVEMFQFLSR